MTTPSKEKKREARREEKAEKAALLEKVRLNPNVTCELYVVFGFLTVAYILHSLLKNSYWSAFKREFIKTYTIILLKSTRKLLILRAMNLLLKKKYVLLLLIHFFSPCCPL